MIWSKVSTCSSFTWYFANWSINIFCSDGTNLFSFDLKHRFIKKNQKIRRSYKWLHLFQEIKFYIYPLIIVMHHESGIHQTLPRSPWFSIILISFLVATFASMRDLSSGNIFLKALLSLLSSHHYHYDIMIRGNNQWMTKEKV